MKLDGMTRACVATILALMLLMPQQAAFAATPATGTIDPNPGDSVTWDGFEAAGLAASATEDSCVEGTNCDTFTLTVGGTPEDWEGKVIEVRIQWMLGANDYDLFIHKDSNAGPETDSSGDGAPVVQEQAAIHPSSTGTGVYTIHVVYFAVTAGDPYVGSATVTEIQQGRVANYIDGGATFSPDMPMRAPVSRQAGEPSSRTDIFGNFYVAGIRGVPAGTDLWYVDLRPDSVDYDPWMRNPAYRGQPDEFLIDEGNAASVGGDGGGDIDLAVGFGNFQGGPPFLASVSLVAANISATRSVDRGETFVLNPVGSEVPVDDRQWIEAYGENVVYLYYRTISVPVFHYVQRSEDGGLTYGPPVLVGTDGQTGYIDVDQNDGTVYLSRQSGSTVTVAKGVPALPGLAPATYTDSIAVDDTSGAANIFAPIKVADDGTVYVVYSNTTNIYLTHSSDGAVTWADPVRVSNGPETRSSLMPWLETGRQPGSVAVVWFGTASPSNTDDAEWNVFFAQTFDGNSSNPTFRQVKASDHVIHGSNISTGGLLGAANRNLIDYFQVSIDPLGAAVIAYTDDHNDYAGHTYVTRQIGGLSFNDKQPLPDPGPAPAPTPAPADGSQVVDFLQDQTIGLLGQAPVDSPFDITAVRYSCEDSSEGKLLVTTMTVSDLSVTPPAGNWRINWAANAPDSVMSPTGEFSFGVSDHGDQFFARASTETDPAGTFTYGTAVRGPDGSMIYTTQGTADSGAFDNASNTITLKVALSKMNPFTAVGPAIDTGTVLTGLRGQSFTSGANAITDITRGGLIYTVPADCGVTGAICGNGLFELGEECDDGGNVAGDGCNEACQVEACGNGRQDAGEECDDSNTDPGDGCNADCQVEACGNGRLDAGEECDDDNTAVGDGCDDACRIEACGNGRLDAGEQCDDGNTDSGDGCDEACAIEGAECGDGIVGPAEECDDGNTAAGDGCDAECRIEACGNGRLDAGEECDDGNTASGDGCDAACRTEGCGNGRVDAGEECDDGNLASGDGCDGVCRAEVCGNGRVDAGEACDDGNTSGGDGCDGACRIEACGNGRVDAGEECDDGNTSGGDGCSAACTVEVAECGNGIVEAGEACDGMAGACPNECRSDCSCPTDGSIHKVTGGGRIHGKSINFGFNAKDDLSGHVNYKDKDEDLHLVSTGILSFVVTGENEVTFSGTGDIDGSPVTFEITVVDNGEPGSNDIFRIEIGGVYARSGSLTNGNVQVHR